MQGGDSAGEQTVAHPREPCFAHALAQCGGIGKAADAFDQITIGVFLAGDDPPQGGHHREGITVVEIGQDRRIHAAEFEAEEAPARRQYAVRFA